ncbi:MAG: hypothetical protein JWP97_248 [Labilithrix sp.]|nr:hypothetical protein [Labilithrix sp.]
MVSRERPLTAEETRALVTRRDTIASRAAARIAKEDRDVRAGARWVFAVAAFFAAVVVFALLLGALRAALAASSGVLLFGAIGRWLARQPSSLRCRTEDDEIRRLTAMVSAGAVQVHDLFADAALVISLRADEDELIGDVLRMGNELFYVRRRTIGTIAPERLPNRHLRLVDPVDGIIASEALGERIDEAPRVVLDSEDELFEHLVGELVALEMTLDELARRLGADREEFFENGRRMR